MSTTGSEAQSSATTAASRGTAYRILRTLGVSPSLRGSGAPISARSRQLKASLTACSAVAVLALVPAGASAQDTCPNAQFRTGASASLPDCRAYELISPPDAVGHPPVAKNFSSYGNTFDSTMLDSSGGEVVFQTIAGSLPGYEGNGLNDRYRAIRTAAGWQTSYIGPTAAQSEQPWPGGLSADLDYYFIDAGGAAINQPDLGSLAAAFGGQADYIRLPSGEFELIGRGSLGEDPRTRGYYMTPGASHVIFGTGLPSAGLGYPPPVQLEPDAPPSGTGAIYDRELGGDTKVVSLLPGDVTPAAGQWASFLGTSVDGAIVAFKLGAQSQAPDPPLYVRVDNAESYEVTSVANTFGGIFGGHVFYGDASSGAGQDQTPADLFSFDTSDQSTTQITDTGDARFVNVSDDGGRVYFISPSQIGGEGTAGEPNLYLWERDGDETTYVATLASADVTKTFQEIVHMAMWTQAVSGRGDEQGRAVALNRSTSDGSILVFEASAQLTGSATGGHRQVYRYEADGGELTCISCLGAGPASSPSRLQTVSGQSDSSRPLGAMHPAASLSPDGETVVFETAQKLVSRDSNGEDDVYRWTRGQGVALISSGRSGAPSYLYGVTPDTSSIMFVTAEDLVSDDRTGATRALYVARVGGGFAGQAAGGGSDGCVGDECQAPPAGSPPPGVAGTGSVFADNPATAGAKCGQFERKAKRASKGARKLAQRSRKAKRNGNAKRAKTLNRKAKSLKRKSNRLQRRAKRCRGGSQ